ncbi:MAG: SDR family NAD(P)-dependent oxidoreductase [Acetobacteraceae bacterium]|nr:SDR family NAD(P)-dependent oxidoreductase [Acetobacteraceae bacterium]
MSGEIAIVTGGLRGLGRAMALGLLHSGRRVVACGHIESDIPDMIQAAGAQAEHLHCLALDLRKPAACDRLIAETQARFGGIDILVNNAGLTFTYFDPDRFTKGPKMSWELTDEQVQTTMDTNYMVADQLTRRVIPILLQRGWGRVVNVTTKLDTMNRPGSIPYGSSKAALEMASEIWGKELAKVGVAGVTCNIVNPGAGANTPGMSPVMRELSAVGKGIFLIEAEAMVPPLLFVCSREADRVNGYRFDATTWDCTIPPAASAVRTGRKSGFQMFPLSDCYSDVVDKSTLT